MDTENEQNVEYGPHQLTKKERKNWHQSQYRERHRDKLKEYKREYDAKRKEAARLGLEMLRLMEKTKT